MGWGDEIIASGQARRNAESSPSRRTVIRDRYGQIRVHEAWKNNPRILLPSERIVGNVVELINGPGVRPYIKQKTDKRWIWNEWDCPLGEIYLTPQELAKVEDFAYDVIVEPNLKAKASVNKDWGRDRWQALVNSLLRAGLRVAQLGPDGTQLLQGAKLYATQTMRMACAALTKARIAVLPEGGLHHSAAALGVKSIVIFGGYISPRQTGYANQINLFTGVVPCGMRVQCDHCKRAMEEIEPEQITSLVMENLNVPASRDLAS